LKKIFEKRVTHQFRNSNDFAPILVCFRQPESLDELFDLVSSKPIGLDLSTKHRKLMAQEIGFPESNNSLEYLRDEVFDSLDSQASLTKSKKHKIVVFIFFRFIYRIRAFVKVLINRASYQSAFIILWRSKVRQIDDLIM